MGHPRLYYNLKLCSIKHYHDDVHGQTTITLWAIGNYASWSFCSTLYNLCIAIDVSFLKKKIRALKRVSGGKMCIISNNFDSCLYNSIILNILSTVSFKEADILYHHNHHKTLCCVV